MNAMDRAWVLGHRLAQRRETRGLGEQAVGARFEPRRNVYRVAVIVGGDTFEDENGTAERAAYNVGLKLEAAIEKLDDAAVLENLMGHEVCA